MGTPIPFVPFQNRAWCKKMVWSKGGLTAEPSVDGVHDGDTAWFFIDKGEYGYDNSPCRLYGIDTPEMNDADPAVRAKAVAARDYLRDLILGKQVYIIKVAMDPHDRPVVIIWTDPAVFGDRAKSVNRLMVDVGHAIFKYQTHGPLE